MAEPQREFYCFLSDANGKFYYTTYDVYGFPVVNLSATPVPLKYMPSNFDKFKIDYGTNTEYFSMVRSISYVFEFIRDGAEIMRYVDYMGVGYASEVYLTIIRWNGAIVPSKYNLYYKGRVDVGRKKDTVKTSYKANCVDASAWGILSMNNTVQYQIDCSAKNPKAIRVLFDGAILKSQFVFQPVETTCDVNETPKEVIIPMTMVAEDGDAFGIITGSQNFQLSDSMLVVVRDNPDQFFFSTKYDRTITIKGIHTFSAHKDGGGFSNLQFALFSNLDDDSRFMYVPANRQLAIISLPNDDVTHQYTFNIDLTLTLVAGEKLTFGFTTTGIDFDLTYIPKITNIVVGSNSKPMPTVVYCLRPLDLLQSLVAKATNNRYTINSNFYTINNKTVLTCGNALRGLDDAYITSSFDDWFRSFDSDDFLAMKQVLGELWVEPAVDIYDETNQFTDIGELTDVEIEHATEFHCNQIDAGSPVQDYRHPSGRLEYNTTNKFSVSEFNVKKKIEVVSVYRKDSYGAEFIRLDYQEGSSVDNSGDTDVFMIDITDEQATALTEVENFMDITVNTSPLAPLIRYPFTNDTITNLRPTLRGVCQPSTAFNVYADGSLDGAGVSDANGNWEYTLVNDLSPYFFDGTSIVNDGVHTLSVTFTDMTGTHNDVTLIIQNGVTFPRIIYPGVGDGLYNNKPLIKGIAQTGTVLNIIIDGIVRGTATADGSCRWFFQSPILFNGTHVINAGGASVVFTVNSWTQIPLITSFDDGFQIVNDLPLIEGVGIPGTTVYLFANYYPDFPFGSAVVDANGNWSFQTVPVFKTGGIEPLTPFPNGDNIISTDLEIKSTFVSITGYKLNRPAYDSISGVVIVDGQYTSYNTELSPMRSLIARMPLWKSIWFQQPSKIIEFQSTDKNQDLTTSLGGVIIKESNDLALYNYPDVKPLFFPAYLIGKAEMPFAYTTIMNLNAGGYIKATYMGRDLYLLPIGNSSVDDVNHDVQKIKFLISAKTPVSTLLQLSDTGLTFQTMENAITISDYNTLHFVRYNFTVPKPYKLPDLYDDWFEYRNGQWLENPAYIQKWESYRPLKVQVITNGVVDAILSMYDSCSGKFVNSFTFTPVVPQPIVGSLDIIQEATIDLTTFSGNCFFVLYSAGTPVAITESLDVQPEHYGTIFIQGYQTKNKAGMFFSTGYKCEFYVEGMVTKLQVDLNTIINQDEVGNYQELFNILSRKRNILLGHGEGLPDYLYLKIFEVLNLESVFIEGIQYVISKNAGLEPHDKQVGYPMYHYEVEMDLANNNKSLTVASGTGAFVNSVVLVVDAEAFGRGGSELTNIELKQE